MKTRCNSKLSAVKLFFFQGCQQLDGGKFKSCVNFGILVGEKGYGKIYNIVEIFLAIL